MFRRLFGGSNFLKKMNTLLELYGCTHNTEGTYKELLKLEKYIRTEGEKALFDLNRASLLYDLGKYHEAFDILLEIPRLNPELNARCENLKSMIREEM